MLSKIKNLIRLCRVTRSGDGEGQLPVQQVEFMGQVGDSIMVFPFGMHANVSEDALAVMFSIQGDAENRAAIGMSESRPVLSAGEVAIYHPDTGAIVKMKSDGNIELQAANINIIGDVAISGKLTVGPLDKDFLTHIHVGSPTAPVGAITPTGVLI